MKIFSYKTEQKLPIGIDEAWDFFSSPLNLKKITPDYMGFDIINEEELGDFKMYPGMIISYIIKPLFNIPVKWTTEITQVEKPYLFVDNQLSGPYKLWHHKHIFKEVEGGILMTDLVHYALPAGKLGATFGSAFVHKRVKEIFDYRYKTLESLFNSK
jgi:ligand-binding SRPBCC domain-containing protein